MTRRLQELSEQPLETCDVYFLLDFLHNIYTRYTHLRDWDWTRTGTERRISIVTRTWAGVATETKTQGISLGKMVEFGLDK